MTTQTHNLITKMAKVVGFPMGNLHSDFAIYDTHTIRQTSQNNTFPLLWIVSKYGTYMEKLGEYKECFENEAFRYTWAQGGNPTDYYIEHCESYKFYLIEADGMREVTANQAKEIVRDIVTPILQQYKMPKKFKVKVRFHDISLNRLKQLLYEAEKHEDTSLSNSLYRLQQMVQKGPEHYVDIFWNEIDKIFYWNSHNNGQTLINGGIVFHGYPDTGYQTNGSTQLEPKYGWSSHT